MPPRGPAPQSSAATGSCTSTTCCRRAKAADLDFLVGRERRLSCRAHIIDAEFKLYCFAQSGNAFKVSRSRSPVRCEVGAAVRDFFGGETRASRVPCTLSTGNG